MRYVAATVPGVAPALAAELRAAPGVRGVRDEGNDGRSDVVGFDGRGGPWDLRTAEDVFAVLGQVTADDEPAAAVAEGLWDERAAEQALSAYAVWLRPLAREMEVHVVARVLDERRFLRTELREAVARVVGARKPRWRRADPAALELWVWEAPAGRFTLALRLTTVEQRQRGGRRLERAGALRPAVAAAMVAAAGPPPSSSAVLLDPCCGSGTVVAEARAAGWRAVGADIDPEAVAVSTANGVPAWLGDARHVPLPGVDAVVANLPFGHQHRAVGEVAAWIDELRRMVRSGPLLLLAPEDALGAPAASLGLVRRLDVTVLGRQATIWAGSREARA